MQTEFKLQIGFLLGWPEISGGTYVIYEHASRLNRFGHDVYIVTREPVDPLRYAWHPGAAELEWLTIDSAGEKSFDIILATWWESPFLLHKLNALHYVYFIQSIESRFWPPEDPANHDTRLNGLGRDLCESTYTYSLPVITEAGWIKQYLYENYNSRSFLVRNGIRKDLYCPEGFAHAEREPGKLRVLVEGPIDVPYKNVPKTVDLCRRAGADEVWLLTSSTADAFPGVDRVFSRIPIHETPAVYRSCDVLVKLSYIEGMFGPPLELFHCGGTAIVYMVTGHDEYIIHNENGYIVKPDDDECVVEYLKSLKNDQDELARLKRNALATAARWHDWDVSSRQFEKALQDISQGEGTSRAYLERHTRMLYEQHDLKMASRYLQAFIARESYSDGKPCRLDNFVQLYWHSGEGWSQEKCKWVHYRSGDRITVSITIKVDSLPIILRLDPSVQIGVIQLRSITISSLDKGITLSSFASPEDFAGLEVSGTACRMSWSDELVLLSYGDDPQLVFPDIAGITQGDDLEIKIELMESGVRQFLSENVGDKTAAQNIFSKYLPGIFRQKS